MAKGMKYFIITLSIIVFHFQKTFAQDTIIKVTGEWVISKITEISDEEVKFKKFNNQDGPVYIEKKYAIKMIKYSNGIVELIGPREKVLVENQPIDITIDKNAPTNSVSGKIEDYGTHFVYKSQPLNEEQIQGVLFQSGDKRIINLIQKSQRSRNLTGIGYGGIAFGICATIVVPYWAFLAIEYNNNGPEKYSFSERNKYGALAALALAGSIACPIVGGINSTKRKYYNSKAILIYNQNY
jgi:hypothetical protein